MTNETEKRYFKIPFIWTQAKVVSTPLDFNYYKNVEGDNKTALDINLGKKIEGDNKTGFEVNGVKIVSKDNKAGLDFNLIKGVTGDNKTGLDVNFYKGVEGEDFGINVSVISNKVGSVNKGALSYATFYNRINKVGDYGIVIQLSGIYNKTNEVSDKSVVFQFGLLNKIGDNYSLFINAKGLGNISEIIKRKFSKKSKGLEKKLGEK